MISSQAFALNLFGPLADDSTTARRTLNRLLPDRDIRGDDVVRVEFEQTPDGTRQWLGEMGRQPTQIDVLLTVARGGKPQGFVLVEVKLTETGFGGCRVWKPSRKDQPWTHHRARCLDLSAIIEDPVSQCWMAKTEGRRYWDAMALQDSSIQLDQLAAGSPCPFRYGLYQVMRNRLLADAMRRELRAEWADAVVCLHPENPSVRQEPELVAGESDSVQAFRRFSVENSLQDWRADNVLNTVLAAGGPSAWGDWMKQRYGL